MKKNSIHYSDIEQLIKLYTEKPVVPYFFDPYNKLKYKKGEETLTNGESQILVNLGGKLIEYKGVPLETFDLILDFGKAEVTREFNYKSLNYINQPKGHMRWLYQGHNLKSVLSFYNASGRRGKLIAKAIRLCSQLGLQKLVTSGSLKIYSKKSLKLDSSIANLCTDYSIFMGTPGVQRSILVALIVKNKVTQFLKIPTNNASTQLIEHEKEAILSLRSISTPLLKVPDFFLTKNSDALLMENLQKNNSIRTDEFKTIHAKFIADNFTKNIKKTKLMNCEFWFKTKTSFELSRFSANPQLSKLGQLGRKVIKLIDERIDICTHWAHGDFTPWNMVITGNKIALYDWELFKDQAPALFDLFHFHYQKGILMDHSSLDTIQMQLDSTFQIPVLRHLILEKELDIQLYNRLYLLSTVSYFIEVFDQQELSIQNQWQINTWSSALNKEFHLLRTGKDCRQHFMLDLNNALEKIPHAYLKFNYNNLIEVPEASDLDIAIDQTGVQEVIDFCKKTPLIRRFNYRKKSFMSIFEIHLINDSFLSVDLIHQFKRKDKTMLSIKELLTDRRNSKKGVVVPALKHDLAYAYAFYTLNDSAIPIRYHKHFSKDKIQDAINYLNTTFGTTFISLEKVFTEGREGKKALKAALQSTANSEKLKGKLNYVKDTINDIIYNRGFMVTFSGVDGAGKSTIIDIVRKTIEKKYRKEVVVLRHRPGILPILSAIKHGKVKAEKIAGEVLPRKGKNKSYLSSALRFAYYYLDYLIGQVYVYVKYILRGKIVVYDRYYFDFINDAKRTNIKVNKKVATALYCFVMKPKLNIFLYAAVETILTRKQELNAADIYAMNKSYTSLFTALKLNSKKSRYTCIENNKLDNTVAAVLKEVAIVA
jgi:thymidylate kinase